MLRGNVCFNNARLGIGVNALPKGIVLSGNLCRDNPANLTLRGDFCSSTGDFCGGKGGVRIGGRGNQVGNLVALCPVTISATDLSYSGGIISAPPEAPHGIGLQIWRNTTDHRTALIDGVRVRGLTIKNCETAVSIKGEVRDVRLSECRIEALKRSFAIEPNCQEHVTLERIEERLVETTAKP